MTPAFIASDEVSITKSDNDLPFMAYGIYIAGAGTVDYVTANGTSQSRVVTDGTTIPVKIKRVKNSTTATGITGYKL